MKKAVIIYGPPGAGKGTQANLLAWNKGFIHFDTGRFLEQFTSDPENLKDPETKKAKQQIDSGELVTPEYVLKLTDKKAREIAKAGFSVVFSGSPRTVYEATGDDPSIGSGQEKGLIQVLEEEYGKENIYPVFLEIDPEIAIQRNKTRMVCSNCKNAMLYNDAADVHKTCSLCGGKLVKRSVDNPEIFKTRIKEYEERTKPIIDILKKRGYKIYEVNGLPKPVEVFEDIKSKLNL